MNAGTVQESAPPTKLVWRNSRRVLRIGEFIN
jgi:hypothetical protein